MQIKIIAPYQFLLLTNLKDLLIINFILGEGVLTTELNIKLIWILEELNSNIYVL